LAWQDRVPVHAVPAEPIKITETGCYCLLARREAWNKIAWRSGRRDLPYYDFAACEDLRRVGPLYLTDVACLHWQANGEALRP
jgi:hypothetical protein